MAFLREIGDWSRMTMATSAEWAHREFGQAKLKDARWLSRLVLVAAQAARRPAGKVTEVFGNDAARQGAYGLLESEDVTGEQVGASMFKACAKRCACEEFVFCAVDGSSVTVTDLNNDKDLGSIGTRKQRSRGVKVISALAIGAKGVPLGLASQVWWKRTTPASKRKHRNRRRTEEKEIQRWLDTMERSRQVMSEHAPRTKLWFQLDREGDAWPILQRADLDGHWFTIRGNHNRRVILESGRQSYLRDVLAQQPVAPQYELQVSGAPKRTARVANMAVQACRMTLDFRDKRTKKHFSKQVNVVLAREQGTTPSGEKAIEWLLLTNRPVSAEQDIKQIVFGYAQRWRIEDFHRTWKSGTCRVEDSQLRSAEALIKWATILAAVAVRAERIKLLSRKEPDRPASDEFSPVEIRAIVLLRFGKSAKKHLDDAQVHTLAQVTLWLAQIGGYTGKSSGGPPGSVTLTRGLKEVAAVVRAFDAMEATCD
ncbi:MAG TPA: IS4 family transposase [Chloroflexota bacterium]